VIEEKRRKDQEKEQAKKAKTALLNAINPRLDAQAVHENPGTIAELDLQLAWFGRIDPLVPPKSHLKVKKANVRADCLATNTEYCNRCTHAATQATNCQGRLSSHQY
jgi:hypothetical protein